MEDKNELDKRHKELSYMFINMGRSLVDEGIKNKDYSVATIGNIIIFMSSVISDENEVRLLSDLCAMMSSKKMIKGIANGTIDLSKLTNITDISRNDTFQEIIKRIKRDLDNTGENEES